MTTMKANKNYWEVNEYNKFNEEVKKKDMKDIQGFLYVITVFFSSNKSHNKVYTEPLCKTTLILDGKYTRMTDSPRRLNGLRLSVIWS
jgi:hypothetical protein